MKLPLSLILIAMITISCEGPVGPQGEQGVTGQQGIQGEIGPTGLSKTMFDHSVIFADYYQSAVLIDNNTGQGAWMAGIEHDSIKALSEINVFIDLDSVQVWTPFNYIGEIREGRLGLWDPNISLYLGFKLRIVVTN